MVARAEAAPRPARRVGLFAAAWEICKKDARVEARTREITATAGVFSIVVGFLASVAFHVDDRTNASIAAGTIWITIFFAAVLSFGRIWQRERDESALTALLVAPIPRAAIFLGKALATTATIAVIEVPLVLLCMFLFRIDFAPTPRAPVDPAHPLAFVALLLLGTAALSLVGTLFGAMTVRTRARDLVIAITLLPPLSPVLICGVVGSRQVFETQPAETYEGWLGLMGVAVFVALVLGVGFFGALVDE